MYTRDFGQEEAERTIPDTYCGNLFSEGNQALHNNDEVREEKGEGGGVISVFRNFFDKSFDFKNISLFKKGFGTEELLIIGIAAFLLFSRDGDKECAIILLLTLFFS
ncbi:MAG: hypothetical protein IJW38_04850 [Clostridia bacterium]|nr:hypothetical protein [Clostridia bacterium]